MEEKKNNIVKEKEIDFLALANKLWLEKKYILKVLGIGFILGVIIAFSMPREYTTTVVLMPEAQSSSISSMSSLAALAGINLNNVSGMEALASPDLYPDILQSTPFLRGLFNVNLVDIKDGIDTTLYAYMDNYQKAAWWSYIVKTPSLLKKALLSSSEDSIRVNNTFISEDEMNILENVRDRIVVSSDKKTMVTTIQVRMQSPEISAFLADTVAAYLQSYVIDYRTQKAKNDLKYAEMLHDESKANYYKAQKDLAAYIDGNLNVVSATYRTTQDRLQNEANLAYSLYNQMAQQLQMAKIKVQDTTPFFTVIQPAVQPIYPDTSRKKVVIIFMFLAFMGAGSWVLRDEIKTLLM